jgi:hypothetical protein
MPKLTDQQVREALEANGHKDLAEALAHRLDEREGEKPPDMNAAIRRAAGREGGE